jgi:hypothetical protein
VRWGNFIVMTKIFNRTEVKEGVIDKILERIPASDLP